MTEVRVFGVNDKDEIGLDIHNPDDGYTLLDKEAFGAALAELFLEGHTDIRGQRVTSLVMGETELTPPQRWILHKFQVNSVGVMIFNKPNSVMKLGNMRSVYEAIEWVNRLRDIHLDEMNYLFREASGGKVIEFFAPDTNGKVIERWQIIEAYKVGE